MNAVICGCNTGEIKEILKIRLSKKRYTHSLNVADAAVKLADKYGGDREKAYLAGLVHDICKEIPVPEQLAMAKKLGISPTEEKAPPLYHAPAAAWYCENALHITDGDILNSVRYHTAARDNMSLLEEIIYLADLISEDRSYKDVHRMRKLASEDREKAMLEALRFSVKDVIGKGSYLPEISIRAYNYYLAAEKE